MNTTTLTALIDSTTNGILDEWTAEAQAASVDTDEYIADQLDAMDMDTEGAAISTISAMHLRRMCGKA